MNARFMDVELLVERGVLMPRAETELLGATALEVVSDRSSKQENGDDQGSTRIGRSSLRSHCGPR